jgi:hypothetical protein
MKIMLVAMLICTLGISGCSKLSNEPKQVSQQPCVARFVPVNNKPEVALDTQTGSLCRTVADTNDPLGIMDPDCGVSQDMKKVGFVPKACKSGQTWVKGAGDTNPSSLPVCRSAKLRLDCARPCLNSL